MVKKRLVIYIALFIFCLWNIATYYIVGYKVPGVQNKMPTVRQVQEDLRSRIDYIERLIQDQKLENEKMLMFLKESLARASVEHKPVASPYVLPQPKLDRSGHETPSINAAPNANEVALLVFACNRPLAIRNLLDQLLKLRPTQEQFPLYVSQDCNHDETKQAVESYNGSVTYLRQPDQRDYDLPPKQKKFVGYYKIARHYKWALNQTFFNFGHKTVIILEDDLDLSVDFFDYFLATYPILRLDPTLWCVSAWNDNGKTGKIENKPELLYRTDFFPGLGWMITKELWLELEPKWPEAFWDDWMRRPEQRKERACIRPEISRTAMSRFGKVGVSKGLYFDKHLKHIQMNSIKVKFSDLDLSYLLKDNYDPKFVEKVYSCAEVSLEELVNKKLSNGQPLPPCVRIPYTTKDFFKNAAKSLKLMDDFKAGVPRTAYRGVVTFVHEGTRAYFAPPVEWKGYDITWG